jgi:anti-sigma regulatory factor (Ser/Thr protein kinase)
MGAVAAIDLDLPPHEQAAQLARRALAPLRDEVGGSRWADLRLVVSELITNSIKHRQLGGDDTIHLRVESSTLGVRVEVTDSGRVFAPRRPPSPGETTGWGLYLVDRLVDRWGVRGHDGTTVWVEMDR